MTKDHGYYRRAAFLFVPERERFAREVFRICHIRVLASLIQRALRSRSCSEYPFDNFVAVEPAMRQYRNRRWRGQFSISGIDHMPRVLRRNGRSVNLDLRVVYAESCGILGPGVGPLPVYWWPTCSAVWKSINSPVSMHVPTMRHVCPRSDISRFCPSGKSSPSPTAPSCAQRNYLLRGTFCTGRQQRGELSCPCISWLNQGRNRSLTCKDPGLEKRTP